MSRRPLDPRFADGKDADAMRTIGEVSQALGVKPHVLRYWEQQFPMLSPLKRSGGRRYYRRDDIALLDRIHALVNDQGYTLKGARMALEAERIEADDEGAGYGSQVEAPEPGPELSSAPAASQAAEELPFEPVDAQETVPAVDEKRDAEVVSKLRSIRDRLSAALGG